MFENDTSCLTARTPQDGFVEAIRVWEGGFQAHPNDSGNWVNGKLVGTNFGVTPAALASFRGVDPGSITAVDMKTLSLDEAVAIGMAGYYSFAGGWDALPYCPAVEVYTDIGWGSGPRTAVKAMQRMVGTGTDGVIGRYTINAFMTWLRGGEEAAGPVQHKRAVERILEWREAFYRSIVERVPANGVFLQGWLNRARYYGPNTEWFGKWMK